VLQSINPASAAWPDEHMARLIWPVANTEPGLVYTLRQARSRYSGREMPRASVPAGIAALYDHRIRVDAEAAAFAP
jgi:hypothetical protein